MSTMRDPCFKELCQYSYPLVSALQYRLRLEISSYWVCMDEQWMCFSSHCTMESCYLVVSFLGKHELLQSQMFVHGIGAKLLSNFEQNMLKIKSLQSLRRKKISMLTVLEVSSLEGKCVFYRSEHNAKGGSHRS